MTIYLYGSLATMVVTALLVVTLRKSHAMSGVATSLLIVSTAVVWPLLVVAAIQVFGLLGFAKGLGAIGARSGHVQSPAGASDGVAPSTNGGSRGRGLIRHVTSHNLVPRLARASSEPSRSNVA